MAGPRQSSPRIWSRRACALRVLTRSVLTCGVLTCGVLICGALACGALSSAAAQPTRPAPDGWAAALAARESFEAEPQAEHSRDEFTQVMDNFRAIYHANPGDLHAPRAVDEVAQLLSEQGRELNDPRSLRAAAGQYEFLAKAYPASSLAAPALGHALELLGPDAANDPAEAAHVRSLLETAYPHSAAAHRSLSPASAGTAQGQPASSLREVAGTAEAARATTATTAAAATASFAARATDPHALRPSSSARDAAAARSVTSASLDPVDRDAPHDSPHDSSLDSPHASPHGTAVVTGIRHWSTASYTRVAIDLGGDVQFQAARVEHPDRIFFDLHGARLAPGLAGKSFAITDDGFLKTIRAAQSGPDVTRIVLHVQPVAEYSAFLLPNPYRLIIDIHGRAAHDARSEAAVAPAAPPAPVDDGAPQGPAERVPSAPAGEPAEASTLPPMPVTDGSASFGLPSRRDEPVSLMKAVARPRVVVSARPTAAKPVPNSVTTSVPGTNREVAALSEEPGVIEATAHPTSNSVVEHASRRSAGGTRSAGRAAEPASPVEPAPLTADGRSTLMRALGLKIGRIVIDAGHGGHDSGTLGADGIEEKDVVLDVALRLGRLLHDRLGAEVVYTRADDTFVPLETRTAIANKAQADLFISVHANSSADPSARGVEVYYLNFTSDPEAMSVAGRENAVSSARVNQLSDLVKQIALKDKIDESRELASDVDQSLYAGLKKGNAGLKDRGVKKAPFVVLIGANMPSILAEISFVTNPTDAAKLNTPEYRERVAESLYNGIARYAAAINGGRNRPRPTERAER